MARLRRAIRRLLLVFFGKWRAARKLLLIF